LALSNKPMLNTHSRLPAELPRRRLAPAVGRRSVTLAADRTSWSLLHQFGMWQRMTDPYIMHAFGSIALRHVQVGTTFVRQDSIISTEILIFIHTSWSEAVLVVGNVTVPFRLLSQSACCIIVQCSDPPHYVNVWKHAAIHYLKHPWRSGAARDQRVASDVRGWIPPPHHTATTLHYHHTATAPPPHRHHHNTTTTTTTPHHTTPYDPSHVDKEPRAVLPREEAWRRPCGYDWPITYAATALARSARLVARYGSEHGRNVLVERAHWRD
jgi:hypothetical protein